METSSATARVSRATTSFGGPVVRSRFTDAVWQGPTWSFAILLLALRLHGDAAERSTSTLVVGFVLVMATTVAALFVQWEHLPVRAQALLPACDLVGAALMVVGDGGGAATTLLLCSLPAVWLAFEFGRWGLTVAVATTSVAGIVSVLGQPSAPRLDASSSIAVSTVFVVGLAVVARLMSGVLMRIGAVLHDQTREADAARARAEAGETVVRDVLESIDVGVLVLRTDGEPLFNSQAQSMASRMGLTADALGRGGSRVFLDDATTPVPVSEQAVSRAVRGEEFVGAMERIGEPGDQRVVVVSARQFPRSEGGRGLTVVAAWDATQLVDAIEVREAFLATVSHELRTPLTAVIASVEVLNDGVGIHGDADSTRLLAAIGRNATLLRARIDELLSSAHTDHGPLHPVRTDASSLVRAAMTKHETLATADRLQLVAEIDPGLTADLDPVRYEQLVDNLVSNALKYTAAGGTITVSLAAGDRRLVLRVSDTGIGMTPDEQRQVFDRFYRAPKAKAGAVQGLGIGLSLVKSIVERHGGTIDLRSSLGHGTTVEVALPLTSGSGSGSGPGSGSGLGTAPTVRRD